MTAMLLTGPDQKEGLSLAYVKALATRAGFSTAVPEPDRDSVDVRIMAGGPRRPALDLQLKGTAELADEQDGFRRLRIGNQELQRSSRRNADAAVALVLRRRAYWLSLQRGHEDVLRQDTVTVRIPEGNVLDVATLQTLMERSRSGDI